LQEKNLQAEMVIDINSQDLDKISNIKLDLQLLKNGRKENHQETKPPVSTSPKATIKVSSIKAKATVRPLKDIVKMSP